MNRTILYIGLGLMILTMIAGIAFTNYTRLKLPIFYSNCLEVPIPYQENLPNSQVLFELSYITNSDSKKSVVDISFPEEPEMIFSATENGYNGGFSLSQTRPTSLGTIYGRYSIRTAYVFLDRFDQSDWIGEKELHQAELQFNDGSSMKADLGVIILYRDKAANQDNIIMQSTSSSTDGSSYTNYTISNSLQLQYLESDSLHMLSNLIELKIGGTDYKDFSYHDFINNGTLTMTFHFRPLNNKSIYDNYDIKPKLYYKTQDGTLGCLRLYNIMQKRWFYNYKDVLLYLGERGAF